MLGFVLSLAVAVDVFAVGPALTPAQKLAGVEKGLSAILSNSASLEDIVEPMVKEVKAAIATKKDAECTKVLAKFPEWRKQMTQRQEELTSSGDSERTALLVSVLQNRQSESVEDQLKVAKSADFAALPVADFVVEHSDGKTPLIVFALKFLDNADASNATATTTQVVRKAEEAPKAEIPAASLAGIIAQLEKHEERAEHTVEMLQNREKKLAAIFKEHDGKQKAGTGLNTPAGKFLEKKELRKISKRLATEMTTEKALKTAITDIKNKDLKGLTEAKDALSASMAALMNEQSASSGDFLKLLQTGSARQPTGSFACPYCGAQCVEKCRNTEHKSYSACLTECIAINPVSK